MKTQVLMVMGYLRMTWMYRWLALAVAFVFCLVGWFGVLALPNQYEVTARLYRAKEGGRNQAVLAP